MKYKDFILRQMESQNSVLHSIQMGLEQNNISAEDALSKIKHAREINQIVIDRLGLEFGEYNQ